jgi:hypothetical protein
MGTVVGLTFMFGVDNVLTLALRLGVPVWVGPQHRRDPIRRFGRDRLWHRRDLPHD